MTLVEDEKELTLPIKLMKGNQTQFGRITRLCWRHHVERTREDVQIN